MRRLLIVLFIISLVSLLLYSDPIEDATVAVKDRSGDEVGTDIKIKEFVSDHNNPVKVNDLIIFRCLATREGAGEEGGTTRIKVNGTIIKDTDNQEIPFSGSGLKVEYKVNKAGIHVAECVVDSNNEIAESDEANNRKKIIFSVQSTPLPSVAKKSAVVSKKPVVRPVKCVVDAHKVLKETNEANNEKSVTIKVQ